MTHISNLVGHIVSGQKQAPQDELALVCTPTLSPRPHPLSVADFSKLETLVDEHCEVKPILKNVSNPKKDPDGHIYGWTFETEVQGISITPCENMDQRIIDALNRPASIECLVYHFTRLAAVKRNTKGDTAFQIMLEDLAYDLKGKSEWAVMKACEFFRKQESPFFPDHAQIMAQVNIFDRAARDVGKAVRLEGPKK